MPSWLRPFLLAAALTAALATEVGAQGSDLRFQLNPALARLHERDPEAAARILGNLDRILRGQPVPTQPGSLDRSLGNTPEGTLLEENPLLQQAYRIDPRAALLQLKEIVNLGGGK